MSAAETILIKKSHTTRLLETLFDERTSLPVNLTGKELRLVLVAGATSIVLNTTAGMGFTNALNGSYWWEVTPTNLTTLGEPETLDAFLTIFNTDNSILAEDAISVNVTW